MGRPKKTSVSTSGYVTKKIQSLPGVTDILTSSDALWDILLKRLSRTARAYGFNRVEPPLVEESRLFEATGGTAQQKLLYVSEQAFGRR